MKFALVLVVVSVMAAQTVCAQGKSGEHKPESPGKSDEHKPRKSDGAAAIHRLRRSPVDLSGGFQVGGSVGAGGPGESGGQAGFGVNGQIHQERPTQIAPRAALTT